MTRTATKLSLSTVVSQRDALKRDKFALLAKVGHRKKEASAYQDEAEFYCGIATELLALSVDLVEFLQRAEKRAPAVTPLSADATSRLHRSIKRLLRSWPPRSDSQERLLSLLKSDGLATMIATTEEGYVTLSSDQIVGNVARIIAATKELNQRA